MALVLPVSSQQSIILEDTWDALRVGKLLYVKYVASITRTDFD